MAAEPTPLPDERAEVVSKYLAGMTIRSIAEESGTSYGATRRILVDNGIALRNRGSRGVNRAIPDDAPEFVCSKCLETKSREEFTFSRGRPSRCRACASEYFKAYYAANREARLEDVKRWSRNNPEKARSKNRANYEANREARLAYGTEYGKTWNAANPGRSAERARRRQARLASTQRIPHTDAQRQARWDYYEGRCWLCGGPATEMDHVKPILHLGPDMLSNLRPACDSCNSGKGWKWPIDTHVHGAPRSSLRPDEVTYQPWREVTSTDHWKSGGA